MPLIHLHLLKHVQWVNPSHDLDLTKAAAHVWRIPVCSDINALKQFSSLLQPTELERAARYHQEKDRQRFITARATLRILLAKYIYQSPQEISFIAGDNKKPYVQSFGKINVQFNTSHSGKWILIAIAESEIGIDIEKIDTGFNYLEILHSTFSKEEIDYINKSIRPAESFYLLWTRKEALVKASGKGITNQLLFLPALTGVHEYPEIIIAASADVQVSSFSVDEDYIASVVITQNQRDILFYNGEKEWNF